MSYLEMNICAYFLFSAGVDIEDKTSVDNLHTHLLNTFSFEMKRNHPTSRDQLLVNVFRLVPLIETINRIQSEIIANFSVNRFSKLNGFHYVVVFAFNFIHVCQDCPFETSPLS